MQALECGHILLPLASQPTAADTPVLAACSSHVCLLLCVLLCVLRETLRRDPVVGAVIRVATRDFKLGSYGVPASQTVLLPLRYLAEHDPRWEGRTGEAAGWIDVSNVGTGCMFDEQVCKLPSGMGVLPLHWSSCGALVTLL